MTDNKEVMDTLSLKSVYYMPNKIKAGILYVSEDFQSAQHLCACGCGEVVVTPIDSAGWDFTENNGKPTLSPSVGSFNIPCKSHYWVKDGKIQWC